MTKKSAIGNPQSAIDKSGQSVRAMFSAIAGRYDLLNHLLSANQDKRWRRRAVRLLTPRRGECILDLCCGTGDLAFECARRQPACRVIGADFAVPMLHIADRKTNPQSAIHNPQFTAGDALRLPFGNQTFDAVMVAFGVRNFEDTAAGLREMHRVLKPGGRVLILEFMRPTSVLLQRGFGLFFKHVLPRVGRLISRHGFAYNYLPASVEGFYTRREFEALLRSSGFGNVRSFDYSGGIATSFIAHKSE
jgi:demethylmenaquinone methyltransferase/2-methoxy-6-polyprenyl-1,4-benzoquinol methylase